jgi:archaellum component FlaF (FlaF/FlaG flagellin family)
MPRGTLNKLVLIGVLLPLFAHGQVINEILYSPSTKQWIEVYNNTNASIDLSQYKILDSGASVNGHAVSASQTTGSTVLPSHEYGIVAKDPTSISAAYIFKASLGIKTTGDTVSIKSGSSVTDSTAFTDSTATGGSSLQKFDTWWMVAAATPGSINMLPPAGAIGGGSETGTSTATTTPSTDPSTQAVPSSHYSFVPIVDAPTQKFVASAGRDRLGYTGVPLAFNATLTTEDPNTQYSWSFGDGSVGEGKELSHSYAYSGTYTVVLNTKLFEYQAVSRIRVTIIVPEITVVETSPEFVALKNNSKYEINLYGFKFENGEQKFNFPKDTIIAPGETVRFPSSVIRINTNNVEVLRSGEAHASTATSSMQAIMSDSLVLEAQEQIQRQAAIKDIEEKIAVLQGQVRELAVSEVHKNATRIAIDPVAEKPVVSAEAESSNAATPVLALPQLREPVSATQAGSTSWFGTFKRFLLGQ